MNRGGRPLHKYWEEGKYKKTIRKQKTFGLLHNLQKTICHTAESRLRDHR